MPNDWIIFIDTNILLDFYRQGGESVERQTKALLRHMDRIITGDQIRMEFLKNRQARIQEGASKLPKKTNLDLPALVAESKPAGALRRRLSESEKQITKLHTRFSNILEKPSQYDPVYKAMAKIFDHNGPYNLQRPDPLRYSIRNLAKKRFLLGYPPRKKSDTSIGDALNWEWIIHCAKESPPSTGVMIVTRDQDFGVLFDRKMYLNDWLYREFRDRVSLRKEIHITAKLSDAIRSLDETVVEEDEQFEESIIIRLESGRSVTIDRRIREDSGDVAVAGSSLEEMLGEDPE